MTSRPQFAYTRAARDCCLRAVALAEAMQRNSVRSSDTAREDRLMTRLDGLISKWKDRP